MHKVLVVLGLIGISSACFGQPHQMRESEKKIPKSDTIQNRAYLPGATINLKSQFPIQQAIGLEFHTPIFLSTYIGIGQLSRAYLVAATNFLPDDDPAQATRKRFIQDKLQNGFVLELGTHYHFWRRQHLYVGLNLQFQRFKLPATPMELVEEYDFGDTQGFLEDIQDQLEDSPFLQDFYENALLEPTIAPIQLGITVGKKFYFKKAPRLFWDIEFSYQLNISNRVRIKSESFVGQIIVDNFIVPILDEGSNDSFQGFNLPTLSVRLGHQLGKKVYK